LIDFAVDRSVGDRKHSRFGNVKKNVEVLVVWTLAQMLDGAEPHRGRALTFNQFHPDS
jgi:hypothetical protein